MITWRWWFDGHSGRDVVRHVVPVLVILFFHLDLRLSVSSIGVPLFVRILAQLEGDVRMHNPFVVGFQDPTDSFVVSRLKAHPSGNRRPTPFATDSCHPTIFLHELMKCVEIQRLFIHNGDLERRALQLPEAGNFVQKVQLDSGLGLNNVMKSHGKQMLIIRCGCTIMSLGA